MCFKSHHLVLENLQPPHIGLCGAGPGSSVEGARDVPQSFSEAHRIYKFGCKNASHNLTEISVCKKVSDFSQHSNTF